MNNGLNIISWEIRQKFLCVFKEAVIILVYEYMKKNYGICKNFSFFYLHIGLIPVFLKEVACDVVRTVSLCGNLQNMFFNAQSHLTLTALHEHFLCHTPGLTHLTPQLRLRRDRPMFAAADFKPSDVRFNVRWST